MIIAKTSLPLWVLCLGTNVIQWHIFDLLPYGTSPRASEHKFPFAGVIPALPGFLPVGKLVTSVDP